MLNPSLETKCFNFSIAIFSHSYPSLEHLLTASSFLVILLNSLIVFELHDGHFFGKINFGDFLSLLVLSTERIWGITSPALSIVAKSPILISFLSISSSLCRVALDTITPPMLIGLIIATGVNAPVLPIWISIFRILEIALLEANLWAIAHLGEFATFPSLFWSSKLLIL